jgi:hypothetical protein
MTATAAKATCSSFLRSGRAARRAANRRNRSISAYSGHLNVKDHCIKDCVLIENKTRYLIQFKAA